MGIFSRFADIVNSNINSLLDKAEDPEKMIRLIIQEMEDTLVEVRTDSARTIADKKELERKIHWINNEATEWEQKATLALSKSREDLAKAALIEKKRLGEQAAEMSEQLLSINATLEKLALEVTQLEEKLGDAKSRQQALLLRAKANQSRVKIKEKLFDAKSDDAISRFERFERQLDQVEAKADAYDLGRKKSLSEEIEDLAADDKVNEELRQLKAKLDKESKNKGDAE